MDNTITDQSQLREWAVVDLFGHVKFGALLTLQPLGGTAMLRADIYRTGEDKPVLSKLIGTTAIYSVTFCTESVARALADHHAPDPVSRWDLPALQAPRVDGQVHPEYADDGPTALDDAMIEDGDDEDDDEDLEDPEDEWEAEGAQAEYDRGEPGSPDPAEDAERQAAVDASTIEF